MRSEWKVLPPDGDQLVLDLFRGEPWNGRSPRGLTRGHKPVIFEARAASRHEVFVDPAQLEIWPFEEAIVREGPRRAVSAGAPLLDELTFTRRHDHGETR